MRSLRILKGLSNRHGDPKHKFQNSVRDYPAAKKLEDVADFVKQKGISTCNATQPEKLDCRFTRRTTRRFCTAI